MLLLTRATGCCVGSILFGVGVFLQYMESVDKITMYIRNQNVEKDFFTPGGGIFGQCIE